MTPVDRVRAYALFCAAQAKSSRDELDASIALLVTARDAAEGALERCNQTCEYAERIATFAARAMAGDVDDETLIVAANAIDGLVGPQSVAAERRSA